MSTIQTFADGESMASVRAKINANAENLNNDKAERTELAAETARAAVAELALQNNIDQKATTTDIAAAVAVERSRAMLAESVLDAQKMDRAQAVEFATAAQGVLADTAIQPADMLAYQRKLTPGTNINIIDNVISALDGGGGGTTNYNALSNRPMINGVTLQGNQSAAALGLATATQGARADTALQTETDPVYNADKPYIALKSELPNPANFATAAQGAKADNIVTNGAGDLFLADDGVYKTPSGSGSFPPVGGVVKSDLAQGVRDSLDRADTSLQTETDPVFNAARSSLALKSELPTNTSDLTNDGEDGTHPFITAEDLDDVTGVIDIDYTALMALPNTETNGKVYSTTNDPLDDTTPVPNAVEEAPINGTLYGRKDTVWAEAASPAQVATAKAEAITAANAYTDNEIANVNNLGTFRGNYGTLALIPTNISAFVAIHVNDFVEITADETHGGANTRYRVGSIAGNGNITWSYNGILNIDTSGKMNLVSPVVAGNFATLNSGGQAVDSGKKPADFQLAIAATGTANLLTAPVAAGGQPGTVPISDFIKATRFSYTPIGTTFLDLFQELATVSDYRTSVLVQNNWQRNASDKPTGILDSANAEVEIIRYGNGGEMRIKNANVTDSFSYMRAAVINSGVWSWMTTYWTEYANNNNSVMALPALVVPVGASLESDIAANIVKYKNGYVQNLVNTQNYTDAPLGVQSLTMLEVLKSNGGRAIVRMTENYEGTRVWTRSIAQGGTWSTEWAQFTLSTPAAHTITASTVGHTIKTNIQSNQNGVVCLNFRGQNTINSAQHVYDTNVTCRVNSNGTISANYFHQYNKMRSMRQCVAYVDTDSTWTFFLGHDSRYIKVEAEATFYASAAYSTAVPYANTAMPNRVTNITAQTAYPATSLSGYSIVGEAYMFDSLTRADMVRTVYIATGDGDNNNFQAPAGTRAQSYKTIARALTTLPKGSNITIQINKNVAPLTGVGSSAITTYASGTSYAVGARCTYNGYVYEAVVATQGTAPTIAMTTPWKHVNLVTTTHGAYDLATTYAVGNTVEYNGLTYYSLKASNTGNTPVASTDSTSYWTVCGEYNPVVTDSTPSIQQFGSVTLQNGDGNIKIIFQTGLTLSQNKIISCSAQLCIAGTMTASYIGSVVCSGIMEANAVTYSYFDIVRHTAVVRSFGAIDASYGGSVAFGAAVNAGTYINSTNVGSVTFSAAVTAGTYVNIGAAGSYYFGGAVTAAYIAVASSAKVTFIGNVTVNTDNLTRVGINVNNGSEVVLYATTTINGFAGANTGSGIYSNTGSKVKLYGTVAIGGFRENIITGNAGEVENYAILTLNKPATNTTATCYAIQVNARSSFKNYKGATITRNGGLTDNINAAGTYIDYTNDMNVSMSTYAVPANSNLLNDITAWRANGVKCSFSRHLTNAANYTDVPVGIYTTNCLLEVIFSPSNTVCLVRLTEHAGNRRRRWENVINAAGTAWIGWVEIVAALTTLTAGDIQGFSTWAALIATLPNGSYTLPTQVSAYTDGPLNQPTSNLPAGPFQPANCRLTIEGSTDGFCDVRITSGGGSDVPVQYWRPFQRNWTTPSSSAWANSSKWQSDFKTNEKSWVANQEYDFGDGTYGKRVTGNIVGVAGAAVATTLVSSTSPTWKFISCDGNFQRGIGAGGQVSVGDTLLAIGGTAVLCQSSIYMNDAGTAISLISISDQARVGTTNNAFDVWIRYSK